MRRTMLKSKIHRGRITGSDLNYVGSITIDSDLLEAADVLEHELVHVLDVDTPHIPVGCPRTDGGEVVALGPGAARAPLAGWDWRGSISARIEDKTVVFETYTIAGAPGSGELKINGAAARLVHTGDMVIVVSYAEYDEAELESYVPRVVHVDANNRIVTVDDAVAELLS